MMTIDDERGEGGKKCSNLDDVICERPLNIATSSTVMCTNKFKVEAGKHTSICNSRESKITSTFT